MRDARDFVEAPGYLISLDFFSRCEDILAYFGSFRIFS